MMNLDLTILLKRWTSASMTAVNAHIGSHLSSNRGEDLEIGGFKMSFDACINNKFLLLYIIV